MPERNDRLILTLTRGQLYAVIVVCVLAVVAVYSLGVSTGKRLTVIAGGDCDKGLKAVDKAAELEKALKAGATPQDAGAPLKEIITAVQEAVDGRDREKTALPQDQKDQKKAEKTAGQEPSRVEAVKPPAAKPVQESAPRKEKPREKSPEAQGPPVREPPAPAVKEPSEGEFSVQVAALPDRNDAVALAAQLERKDYGAVQISTTQIPGKGTMYRVRIGHFATREEANAFRQEFERKERKSAFVTPAK